MRDAGRVLLGVMQPEVAVLGNQKSGTTAVAALLAEHVAVRATLDIPDLWGEDFRRLRSGETSFRLFATRHPRDFATGVLKEPNLTFLYPQLHATFPKSRVVFVVRDPRANIRSILSRLGLPGDVDDLSEQQQSALPVGWRPVFDPSALGTSTGTYIETLAQRWNAAVDVYLRHAEQMTLLKYEDFVTDKTGSIAAIADALGLPSRRDIGGSVDRPFQPAGSRAPYERFFGERNLTRIVETCGDNAGRLGYSLRVDFVA
jgi:hypothetical protein